MFKLTLGDWGRGFIVAVLSAVAVAIVGVLNKVITPDFDVFTLDYITLFKDLTNTFIISAYSSAAGYLLKNLLTDDSKKFMGVL